MNRMLAISIVCTTFILGFLFFGGSVKANTGETVDRLNDNEHELSNMTVKATVTPTSVTLQPIQPRTFRVHSSVPGPNTFRFNPGDGRGWSKVPKYGDYNRDFRYYWSQVGTYTYQGSVTNEYYGPGYPASGTARIRY